MGHEFEDSPLCYTKAIRARSATRPPPFEDAPDEEKNVYQTRQEDHNLVHYGILYGLEPELRKRFENGNAFDTMGELKMIFDTHAVVESYNASEKFFSCMMEENSSVREHLPRLPGYAIGFCPWE